MPYLVTAVVLVGVLCTLDLILTLGVIRRLREHTEMFSAVRDRPAPETGPAVGEEIGAFVTSTVDGDQLRSELLTGDTLMAFFSPGCQPCNEKLPKFVDYARTLPGGRDQVLVTVVRDQGDLAPFIATLSPVARVVVEDMDGALSTATRVSAYPAALWVAPDNGGRLVVTADKIDLDQPVAAPA